MRIAVRHSLTVIALLGALTCVLSVYALSRFVATSSAQRIDRARDIVMDHLELQRCAVLGGSSPRFPSRPAMAVRTGYLPADGQVDAITPQLDEASKRAVSQVVLKARSHQEDSSASLVVTEEDPPVVAGAGRTANGMIAWTVFPIHAPPWVQAWRIIAVGLGVAGLLLVATSAHLAVSMQRGAGTLRKALQSLGKDLGTPVPRPSIRELQEVAAGIEGLARDLQRLQSERELLSRQLAEKDRLTSLGRVAAGVAHEVRNPLAAIKLRIDLIRMDPSLPSATGQELGDVAEEIARVDRLVTDLLVIAGRRSGPRTVVDLRKLVDQRVTAMEAWTTDRAVAIRVRGDASANCDADAVSQVVDNLLRNAVDASAAQQAVDVGIEARDDQAVLRVADRGPGVSADHLRELFEPFFTTKPEGMGLGLALSRAIAVAHRGTLTYRRAEGTTTFELVLPTQLSEDPT